MTNRYASIVAVCCGAMSMAPAALEPAGAAGADTPERAAATRSFQALPDGAYLFSYFTGNGEDGLHLAASSDGLVWEALRGGQSFLKPTVGTKLMRDPCIVRGPEGIFHMVWTSGWWDRGIGLAHSADLIHWSDQSWLPLMEDEPAALNCWAPEIVYDPDADHFVIFWATTIPGRFPETEAPDGDRGPQGHVCNHRMYATATRDFTSFAKTTLLYDPGFNCIDATMFRDGDTWVMCIKDETKVPVARKNLRLARANAPVGPWSPAEAPISPDWVEGPSVLRVGSAWHLYFDAYTRGHYEGLRSTDLQEWTSITDTLSFPEGVRHGTAFRAPQSVVEALRGL